MLKNNGFIIGIEISTVRLCLFHTSFLELNCLGNMNPLRLGSKLFSKYFKSTKINEVQ